MGWKFTMYRYVLLFKRFKEIKMIIYQNKNMKKKETLVKC